MLATAEQQLAFDFGAALHEARHFHPRADDPDFPFLAFNWCSGGDEYMRQFSVPLARVEWGIRQIGTRPNWQSEHWFLSQAEFKARNRQQVNLWRVGGCWVDIDLCSPSDDCETRRQWLVRAFMACEEQDLPQPTLVVWSGNGLHLKWVFTSHLPAQAHPVWVACQSTLHAKMLATGLPSDKKALDVSRILRIVGTYNAKGNRLRLVELLHEGEAHDWYEFRSAVLPYNEADILLFRQRDREREAERKAFREAWETIAHIKGEQATFEENRRKAKEFLKGQVHRAGLAANEASQSLWLDRLTALRAISAERRGIHPGQRNEWTWIIANGMAQAYDFSNPIDLHNNLCSLIREIVPTYTTAEVRSSASSVYARLKQGKDKLYRFKTSTLINKLGISEQEAQRHGLLTAGRRGHGTKNEGAMGLPQLRDLPFEEWQRKVRERFAMGGAYAAAARDESALTQARVEAQRASVEARTRTRANLVEQARQMRAEGLRVGQIAFLLDVPKQTISRWLQDV